MRLSEAIRLGSLTIQEPRRHDITTCAIAMGCAAIGRRVADCNAPLVWSSLLGFDVHPNYRTLTSEWPWTVKGSRYFYELFDMFDYKVSAGTMTLEALCDQVRAWEDELAAKGINVEQVTMIATPETTHEPAAEKSETLVRV